MGGEPDQPYFVHGELIIDFNETDGTVLRFPINISRRQLFLTNAKTGRIH